MSVAVGEPVARLSGRDTGGTERLTDTDPKLPRR